MARILLTGGSGFIGMNIAEALLARGDEVVLFSDRPLAPAVAAELDDPGGRLKETVGDVRDPDQIEAAARHCDAAIHGAAITPARPDARTAARAIAVNVAGCANAVGAILRARVPRLVVLGSGAVYRASRTPRTPNNESTTPPAPETVYGVTKLAGETVAALLARDAGLDCRVVRVGAAYGPWERDTGVRDTLSPIFQVTAAALNGVREVVLPRAGLRDWIHGGDIARAIVRVLDAETPPAGPVNIGPGSEWTVADWCERLSARIAGFSARIAEADERATISFHGDADRAPLDVARLFTEVGFAPDFDLERGVEDYLSWLDRHPRFLAPYRGP